MAEFFTMAALSLGVLFFRKLILLPKCSPWLVSRMWATAAEAPEAEVCTTNVAKASETTVSGTSVVERFRNKGLQDSDALVERSKAVAQGTIPKRHGFEPHKCHFSRAPAAHRPHNVNSAWKKHSFARLLP